MMEAADYVIDIGPGAGEYGGEITSRKARSPTVKRNKESLTGRISSRAKKKSKFPRNASQGKWKERRPDERRNGVQSQESSTSSSRSESSSA
jgi:excinuclease ABC subunit A